MNKIISNKNAGSKERLIQYINYKGITKTEFRKKTGLSHGFLNSGSNLGTNNVEIIISNYPDLSLEWLVIGHGPMLRSEKKGRENSTIISQVLEKSRENEKQKGDISQRIIDLMYEKRFNYRSFGKFLGYTDVSIAQIVKRKCKPNMLFLETLLEKIPDLNPEWLLTGNGRMFRTGDGETKDNSRTPQVLLDPQTDQQSTGVDVQSQEAIAYSSDSKEKDLIIKRLETQLAEQKQSYERIMSEKDRLIEEQKSNFEQVVSGRDKQIEDLKNNLGMVISSKDEMLSMKDQMLEIQAGKIAELEDFKKMQEEQMRKQRSA